MLEFNVVLFCSVGIYSYAHHIELDDRCEDSIFILKTDAYHLHCKKIINVVLIVELHFAYYNIMMKY